MAPLARRVADGAKNFAPPHMERNAAAASVVFKSAALGEINKDVAIVHIAGGRLPLEEEKVIEAYTPPKN